MVPVSMVTYAKIKHQSPMRGIRYSHEVIGFVMATLFGDFINTSTLLPYMVNSSSLAPRNFIPEPYIRVPWADLIRIRMNRPGFLLMGIVGEKIKLK